MKNLAGNQEADKYILEELYLAKINAVKIERQNSEVPYTYIGELKMWKFERAWYYWIASTSNMEELINRIQKSFKIELKEKEKFRKSEY